MTDKPTLDELAHLLQIFLEELDAGRLIIGSVDDHPNETKAGCPPNYWHGRWLHSVRATLERHSTLG